jgi:hypothetical protein
MIMAKSEKKKKQEALVAVIGRRGAEATLALRLRKAGPLEDRRTRRSRTRADRARRDRIRAGVGGS